MDTKQHEQTKPSIVAVGDFVSGSIGVLLLTVIGVFKEFVVAENGPVSLQYGSVCLPSRV